MRSAKIKGYICHIQLKSISTDMLLGLPAGHQASKGAVLRSYRERFC